MGLVHDARQIDVLSVFTSQSGCKLVEGSESSAVVRPVDENGSYDKVWLFVLLNDLAGSGWWEARPWHHVNCHERRLLIQDIDGSLALIAGPIVNAVLF